MGVLGGQETGKERSCHSSCPVSPHSFWLGLDPGNSMSLHKSSNRPQKWLILVKTVPSSFPLGSWGRCFYLPQFLPLIWFFPIVYHFKNFVTCQNLSLSWSTWFSGWSRGLPSGAGSWEHHKLHLIVLGRANWQMTVDGISQVCVCKLISLPTSLGSQWVTEAMWWLPSFFLMKHLQPLSGQQFINPVAHVCYGAIPAPEFWHSGFSWKPRSCYQSCSILGYL